MRKWLSLLAVICLTLGLAACGSSKGSSSASSSTSSGSKKPIVIGAVVAQTGVMSQYDLPAMQAVKFAISDINAAGGVLGRPLKLVEEDYKSDRNISPATTQDVLGKSADVLLVTCDFDFGSPAGLIAQGKGIVSMSLCAGSPRFGPKGGLPLGFSAGVVSQASAAAVAEWAYQKMHWHTAYQLMDPTLRVDIDWSNGFKERWSQLGGTLTGTDTFQNTDSSIGSQISRLKSAKQPDFINIVSYPPGGASAIRQIRAAGITLPIVLNDAMDGNSWFKVVPNLSDVYVVDHASYFGDDPNPKVNELTRRYKQATGQMPPSSLFVDGYVAVQLLADGITKAGTTNGAKVTAAMESFRNEPTVAGPTTFTHDIHTAETRPLSITKIENGKAAFFARVTVQKVPAIVLK